MVNDKIERLLEIWADLKDREQERGKVWSERKMRKSHQSIKGESTTKTRNEKRENIHFDTFAPIHALCPHQF